MDNWPQEPPRWSSKSEKALLLSDKNHQPSPDLGLSEIIEKSSAFPVKFPIETVRCHQLRTTTPEEVLEKNVNSAYPVIHEQALRLCAIFLNHQSTINPKFYKDMTLLQFVDRLLTKRAVAFVGSDDHYLLLDGTSGAANWESVGMSNEKPPLTLENCLSYDEIKLSAFLSVSSHSHFINNGDRNNRGVVEEDGETVEDNGVIIGLIGARLEKKNVMEYREMVKSKAQNTHQYGYGEFSTPTLQGRFMDFYGDVSATYQEFSNQMTGDRFIRLSNNVYFDKLMYEKRIALSIDTLLIEANDRALKENKRAYVHVVGLGLGVWKLCAEQDQIFMDTFAKRIQFFKGVLTNISDICFAYIGHKMAGPYKHGDVLNGIKLHMRNRNPHAKLEGDDEGKLLVVSYPWDGNALPGNEFWCGSLAASGDPAAACSSQIAELHNPHINQKVCARNLRVATLNKGLVTFEKYQQLHKND